MACKRGQTRHITMPGTYYDPHTAERKVRENFKKRAQNAGRPRKSPLVQVQNVQELSADRLRGWSQFSDVPNNTTLQSLLDDVRRPHEKQKKSKKSPERSGGLFGAMSRIAGRKNEDRAAKPQEKATRRDNEERLGTFHVATAAEIEALPIFEGKDAYDNAKAYRDSLLDT